MTNLYDDYEQDYDVRIPVQELKVGQVVYLSDRIWHFARIEATGADWAVARTSFDQLYLVTEDHPPYGVKKKEKGYVSIDD